MITPNTISKLIQNKKADSNTIWVIIGIVLALLVLGLFTPALQKARENLFKAEQSVSCNGFGGACKDQCDLESEDINPIGCGEKGMTEMYAGFYCCVPKDKALKDILYMEYKEEGKEYTHVSPSTKMTLDSKKTYYFRIFISNANAIQKCSIGFYDKTGKPLSGTFIANAKTQTPATGNPQVLGNCEADNIYKIVNPSKTLNGAVMKFVGHDLQTLPFEELTNDAYIVKHQDIYLTVK